jgi:anaerobic dimethyl sulfoxide reductase subunit B (iron-sulfur subunit)
MCFERLAEGQQPICVEACPMFALEVGPLKALRAKHGDLREAEGFKYFERFGPSVTFKPKLRR